MDEIGMKISETIQMQKTHLGSGGMLPQEKAFRCNFNQFFKENQTYHNK